MTTGKEEGNAPYTRGNAIVIPKSLFQKSALYIQQILYHETFHIISRNHPGLRDRLYHLIGFESCGLIQLPVSEDWDRITNPDEILADNFSYLMMQRKNLPTRRLFQKIEKYCWKRHKEK